ncbi:MAG: helix-turn-helix domain-containing protein [Halieaceae bacterium]|jgi:CRP-like cAMP-binding protein|nr:helix-turn-helix domain-containing protein [Halieaceae bacterium]
MMAAQRAQLYRSMQRNKNNMPDDQPPTGSQPVYPSAPEPEHRKNRILAGMFDADFARLADEFEVVPLAVGQVLYEPGKCIDHVYFPITGIVSLIFSNADGASTELAITGKDGVVGLPILLGSESTNHSAVVQGAGSACRLRSHVVTWEIERGSSLRPLLMSYFQALVTLIAQGVFCNRHHTIEQQLCRRLLLSHDQLDGGTVNMTQESIANMLGVRREGVTEAAGKLQAARLISYSRGRITILDRKGIEDRVCECYAVVRAEYVRLFAIKPGSHLAGGRRTNPVVLRKHAEALLVAGPGLAEQDDWDSARRIHELQVHQIELEMQNAALHEAYDEVDTLRALYTDIYEFMPVAYVTIDALGAITQINTAAAILLGLKRADCKGHTFETSLTGPGCHRFAVFLRQVLEGRTAKHCEVTLKHTILRPAMAVQLEGVADEEGLYCRVVILPMESNSSAAAIE